MTLHELVHAMVVASRGRVIPRVLEADLCEHDLREFLAYNPFVQ